MACLIRAMAGCRLGIANFRRERFIAGPRMRRKGDKSIIPQACSRKWAAFIAILFCHGKEANGIFCTVLNGARKHR